MMTSEGGLGASRRLILVTGIIGAASILALVPSDARFHWHFVTIILGPLAFIAALFVDLILSTTKPAALAVREGVGFVVPASRGFRYLVVGEVLMLAAVVGQVIRLRFWAPIDDSDLRQDRAWVGISSLLVLFAGGLVALLLRTAWRGGPRILLTPWAVVQEDWWAHRIIPWEAIRHGQPFEPPRRHRRGLTLIVDRPELVIRRGLFRGSKRRPWLDLQHMRVDPWFLADAIWFYVHHPHRRDAIGTQAEYERFVHELGDARRSVAPAGR